MSGINALFDKLNKASIQGNDVEDIETPTPDIKSLLGKLNVPREETIQEPDQTFGEVFSAQSEGFAGEAFESGKGEVRGLKDIVTKGVPFAISSINSDLKVMAQSAFTPGGTTKGQELAKKRSRQLIGIAKNSPEFLKEIVQDFGETFGQDIFDVDEDSKRFGFSPGNLEIAMEKWKDAPIESMLDAIGVGGLLKVVGKSLFKSTAKIIPLKNKETIQKIIGKGDVETQQILRNVSNKDVPRLIDDLYSESKKLKKMSMSKQLDNVNYAEDIGKSSVVKINQLKAIDQRKMKNAIKKIEHETLDTFDIKGDLVDIFKDLGFLKEGGEIGLSNIEPGFSKHILNVKLSELIMGDSVIDVRTLKNRIESIDTKINWKNPTIADKGLIALRRSYRNKLRNMSPEYDEVAKRVSERLDKFEPHLKKFKKLGSGEKFGKSIFSTKEEMDEFIKLMNKSPEKVAGQIVGDLKTLKTWHAWNSFFKQNTGILFDKIPAVGSLGKPFRKLQIKGNIALGRPLKKIGSGARGLMRVEKKSEIPLRLGLELNQEER